MIKVYILFFASLSSLVGFSQEKLSFKNKFSAKRELRDMLKADQRYRKILTNSLLSEKSRDSLWLLQNQIDSINKVKFLGIIAKIGYPSLNRIGTEISYVLILHFTVKEDFKLLCPVFEKELANKNMPPQEFATWFDRCKINSNEPIFYGAYGKKKITNEELIRINANRQNIGLPSLNEKN